MSPATPNRPPKRPVVGSRTPTSRPRKVAGRARPAEDEAATPVVDPPEVEPAAAPLAPTASDEAPVRDADPDDTRPGLLARLNTTIALVAALVLVVGLLVAEGLYLWATDEPVVSASRPVVTGEMAHRSAVDAASEAAKEIVSIKYQDYDAEVETAASKMTDPFAEEYRRTAEEIRAEFVAAEKEVEVQVVVAGVVRASSEQVQALLFLNQYVSTKGKGTTVTPYRTVVTVDDTESGWLVSDIQTK